jgi:hypothetical protein
MIKLLNATELIRNHLRPRIGLSPLLTAVNVHPGALASQRIFLDMICAGKIMSTEKCDEGI